MIEASTLWELVEKRAAATPDALFARDEAGRRLSFDDLRTQALSTAAGLHALGIVRDTPVTWILPTRLSALVVMTALARLGAVQNPIIPIYREREVGFCLRQSGARWLLVPKSFRGFDYAAMGEALASEIEELETLEIETALPEGDPATLPPPPEPTRPEDAPVRWIFYTSGTTSDPKGARHTDTAVLLSSRALALALDLQPEDRTGVVFPVTHLGGANALTAALYTGSAQLLVEIFDPDTTIPFLAEHGVTHAGAGTVFHRAYLAAQRAQGPEPIFPRVRVFHGGGSPKSPQLHRELKGEIGGVGILSSYGMTECPIIAQCRIDDPDEKLAHTEGRASPPGAEIRVVRPDGTRAAPGEEGELCISGPQLMRGYLDEALDAEAFDADGFFRTGDLGTVDAEGYVRITGRLKDVIKRKGENISALEVEELLMLHPDVSDVAVIGLPDSDRIERCCAVVICHDPEAPLQFDEMVAFLRDQQLMLQKIPEQLEIVSELPRNPSGKVVKRALRDTYSD